jgi:hypothetical protein
MTPPRDHVFDGIRHFAAITVTELIIDVAFQASTASRRVERH